MDTKGELQSQQASLGGNKAPSQYSTLTSKPKHERCVHFHSHYKPQIYFNNMGALFRACKLQRQTVSLAFQRQPESVWWYSNVVRFWGISEQSMVSWQLWSQQQWENVTYPAHHQHHHAPACSQARFLQRAGSGSKKLCTTRIRVSKIPHWWLKRRRRVGGGLTFSSSLTFKFLSGQNLPWSL